MLLLPSGPKGTGGELLFFIKGTRMGPTNVAMVKLYHADQKYRQAQSRYDAASRDVRIQDRKVKDLQTRLEATNLQLLETQATSGNTDLDIRSREGRIEKFREQQQTAKNNKEYQNFLIQINTEKVDKTKAEDELLRLMGEVETLQAESRQLAAQVATETEKMAAMSQKITQKLTAIQSDIDELKPLREAAAAEVPAAALGAYNKLADRFEGEAMAPMEKPDRRVEEYACGACNMSLMVDIYNRLHVFDQPMTCPSCRRFLYIPDDLPPEEALNPRKKDKPKKGEKNDESGSEAKRSSPASSPAA